MSDKQVPPLLAGQPVTQSSIRRLEDRMDAIEKLFGVELRALRELHENRLADHDRRLAEANNAHALAVVEKQKTDAAAVRVQENAVTKVELQTWKDEVNKRLDVMAGAAQAKAVAWSVVMALAAVLINFALRALGPLVNK